MTTKKYVANTHVSLSLCLPSGKNTHISFSPITGGGSVLYVSDEDIAQAIEKHYQFGKLFRLDGVSRVKSDAVPEKPVVAETTEVEMTCWDDAKEYLSDKYGVSRTKLRSAESIKAVAAIYNIKFIGIE